MHIAQHGNFHRAPKPMQTPGDVLGNPDGLCKQIRRRATSNLCYAIAAFEFAISYWHYSDPSASQRASLLSKALQTRSASGTHMLSR